MTEIACLSPSDRFNSLIEGMFSDVATVATNPWCPANLVELMMIKLVWRRLRRMSRRFAAIMARLRAGTLAQAATRPEGAARPAASPRAERPSQRSGWVIYAISWFLWNRHYELDELLEAPEMVAQVAEAPQLGGVLRPLCRMLAVKPPAWLRRPRKPRPSRAVVHPPAPDFMLNDPAAILKPDGTVWMRFGASTLWRPGCGETLEEMQKYDRPQRIWPRRE